MLCNYWVFIAASIARDPNSIVQPYLKAINVVCIKVCTAYHVQIGIYPATTLCMLQQYYAWFQQADALFDFQVLSCLMQHDQWLWI